MDAVCTEAIIYDEQTLDSGGQSERTGEISEVPKKKNTSHNPIMLCRRKIDVKFIYWTDADFASVLFT